MRSRISVENFLQQSGENIADTKFLTSLYAHGQPGLVIAVSQRGNRRHGDEEYVYW